MLVPSYFTDLATSASLQLLLDSSALELQSKTTYRDLLTPGLPQISLSFDAAIGRERVASAASVVDRNAPAPKRAKKNLELYKGKIPAIKEMFEMDEDDMRALEQLRLLPNGQGEAMVRFLDSSLQEAAVAPDKRIDFMMWQELSTLTVDINATNNPDGANFGVIDLLAKPYQMQGVPKVWTDVTSTPITDIQLFVQNNYTSRGKKFGKILMEFDTFINFQKTTQVADMLKSFFNIGKANGTFANTMDNINTMFIANRWPTIEIVQSQTAIEVDGVQQFMQPFKSGNVSFVPAGKLGILHNAIAMEELKPVAGKSYAKFGQTLLSKWAESNPLKEFTHVELNAFPMIDIDNVFVLDTNVVQASFT